MKRNSLILSWGLLWWFRLWIDFNLKDLSKLLQTSTWSFLRNESNIEIFPWNWTFQWWLQGILNYVLCLPCCQGASAAEASQLSKLFDMKWKLWLIQGWILNWLPLPAGNSVDWPTCVSVTEVGRISSSRKDSISIKKDGKTQCLNTKYVSIRE